MPILRKNDANPDQPFSFTPTAWRLIEIFFAEVMGTAMLLFFGCSSLILWSPDGVLHPWTGPVTFSVLVATIIQVFGHISGCHLNPVITINVFLLGQITQKQALVYFIAEFVGATSGYALLKWVTPCHIFDMNMERSNMSFCQTLPNPNLNDSQGIVLEFLATGVLVLVNCGVADWRNANNGATVSLKFAVTIMTVALAVGPYTGASLNPMRTLGPAMLNGNYSKVWIYFVGPLLAAVVFTFIYQVLFEKKQPTPSISPESVPLKEVTLHPSSDDEKE